MTASLKALGMCVSVVCLSFASTAIAQVDVPSGANTMRPVIRGRKAAVSSMKAEATDAEYWRKAGMRSMQLSAARRR